MSDDLQKQSADAAALAMKHAGNLITALHTLLPTIIELGDEGTGGLYCEDDIAAKAGAMLQRITFLNSCAQSFQSQAGTVEQIEGNMKTLILASKELADNALANAEQQGELN